ncbi:hypothetical protein SAMN05216353_14420 [Halobacillus alkaliphilus]|uniref:Uncharacterized protein n=1 Tax=Halobacillus alkaliphilus TaxID=396056 RepID=A0A1I2RX23_9BACI|nr:hypothetical protein [Halobacillus alkaliphilus]SFG45235.1 hypothetical protein SAMN05216353_14420 [Halobacillus alkaliphilus]
MKKMLSYISALFGVFYIISFVYALLEYGEIRVFDLAAIIILFWASSLLRRKHSYKQEVNARE